MGKARASVQVPGFRASEAEALWYDTSRWPTFVDGFAHVVSMEGEWPAAPSTLVWQSTPAGRGRVLERVTEYEPRLGQTAQVEDPKMSATQRIAFTPAEDGVEVTLSMEYTLKEGGPLRPFMDFLFIRRAVTDALKRTVQRFARELETDAEMAGE
ncbi:MAG: SRPBCC family protein [Solirubrobacteraceae bacterium]